MKLPLHQYIERKKATIKTERLLSDRVINLLYSRIREVSPFLFEQVVSKRVSALLGFLNYDLLNRPLPGSGKGLSSKIFKELEINPEEIWENQEGLEGIAAIDTYRKLFERQIRYWECRPMEAAPNSVVAPADSRVLIGSFPVQSNLLIKNKFFSYSELIGTDKAQWLSAFDQGDYAVFRLTPDKYHYNHTPVAGRILDTYEINGNYHSCNPGAVVQSVTPYSKNRRILTIIDTDVENGSQVGLVAMVEIVALMIGRITQCYSRERYDNPYPLEKENVIQKGQPKSLFAPGSSTTVLIFQKNKVQFSSDLVENQNRSDVESRFTLGFKTPLVETDLHVRETIAKSKTAEQ